MTLMDWLKDQLTVVEADLWKIQRRDDFYCDEGSLFTGSERESRYFRVAAKRRTAFAFAPRLWSRIYRVQSGVCAAFRIPPLLCSTDFGVRITGLL